MMEGMAPDDKPALPERSEEESDAAWGERPEPDDDEEDDGGDAGSQAQPIQAVLDMIRTNAEVWGDDFKVWTQ